MRDNFKSSFGVLVAMAGSAIGLGNLWRFPYLMGTNGGAAFIIIYLVLVFLLCLPIMMSEFVVGMSEFVVGRRSQVNAVKAFKVLSPKGHWGLVGVLGVLASVALISFYCVVGGWTIDYLVHAVSFTLPEQGSSEGFFAAAVSTPWRTILYTYIYFLSSDIPRAAGRHQGRHRALYQGHDAAALPDHHYHRHPLGDPARGRSRSGVPLQARFLQGYRKHFPQRPRPGLLLPEYRLCDDSDLRLVRQETGEDRQALLADRRLRHLLRHLSRTGHHACRLRLRHLPQRGSRPALRGAAPS